MKRDVGFTLIELLIVVAIIGIIAILVLGNACRPQCELRRITGCDFTPAHMESDYTCSPSFDGEVNCHWDTDYVHDRWDLTYDRGWSRTVSQTLCEREGPLMRWEFRDGSHYQYLDSPVAECTSES